jgi:hypothetical protein
MIYLEILYVKTERVATLLCDLCDHLGKSGIIRGYTKGLKEEFRRISKRKRNEYINKNIK